MKTKRLAARVLFAALAALPVLAGCGAAAAGSDRAESGRPAAAAAHIGPEQKIRGVSFSAPRREMAPDALVRASLTGANWVAVVPYAFVDPAQPRVAFDRERQFWGERTEGIAKTIEYARESRLSVLLKPHLWVRGQGWPGEFEPDTEEDWEMFLSGYREYILRFAHVADSMDVEMFSVGTEVDLVALARPDYWRSLIEEVRAIYGGRLTYAANWDKYARIEFWDALDLVGVDAYFPLADDATPEVEPPAWEAADRFSVIEVPQADVLVIGLCERFAYGSADNPLIAAIGVGYPPRVWLGDHVLRRGGVVIGMTPSTGQIDGETYPSYQEVIDLYAGHHEPQAR